VIGRCLWDRERHRDGIHRSGASVELAMREARGSSIPVASVCATKDAVQLGIGAHAFWDRQPIALAFWLD
jgi:hypothetical protein